MGPQTPAKDFVAIEYRPEIDGLRALSVSAVILFHARVPGFAGGYVGVDVFFVISGYLITRLLTAGHSLPLSRQLATFYVRRARRILPALLFMLVVCTAVAAWLFLPQHLVRYGRSLALSSALLGNVSAWQGGDYFDPSATLAPLLHLWSIAVEEQFYIVFPAVLLLLGRYLPRFKVAAIGILALASFLMCVWGSYDFPRANYYLAPPRGWQLLLGALLALSIDRWKLSRPITELLTVVALLALGAAIHGLDSNDRYPGVLALVPSVATVVLIGCTQQHSTAVGRLLATRLLVFTGLISYSLYLWHAPALALYGYFNIVEPSAGERSVLLVATYALAAFSWWMIESPIRAKAWLKSTPRFALAALAISSALIVIGVLMWRSEGFPQRFSPRMQTLAREPWPLLAERSCILLPLESIAAGQLCKLASPGTRTARAVVWGDSHALALLPAYREIARARNVDIYFAIHSACRPLLGVTTTEVNKRPGDHCQRFNAAMVQAVQVLQPDVVILNAYWTYPNMNLIASARVNGSAEPPFRLGLGETLRRVGAPARSVCTVLDVPAYEQSVPYALAIADRRGIDTQFMALSRAKAVEQQQPAEREIRALGLRGLTRIADPKEALCKSGTCLLIRRDGVPLYRDAHHLSSAGAAAVVETLHACFESAPGQS